MHTAELLKEAIEFARTLGYGVRYEWLGGASGGACTVRGKQWLFVDLSLSTVEQCEQVLTALRNDPAIHQVSMPPELAARLMVRRAA